MSPTPRKAALQKVHAARRGGDVDYLLEAARREPDIVVRGLAIRALGLRREAGAVPILRQLLGAKDVLVRVPAIRALGRIGDPGTFDDLFQVARTDESLAVRATAIKVLLDLGQRRAVPLLGDMIMNPLAVRREVKWAVKMLRVYNGVEAVPVLRKEGLPRLGWRDRIRLRILLRKLAKAAAM